MVDSVPVATISTRADTVRPSVDCRSDDTAFGTGIFSWQDPVYSWNAGPGEVMTVGKQILNIVTLAGSKEQRQRPIA